MCLWRVPFYDFSGPWCFRIPARIWWQGAGGRFTEFTAFQREREKKKRKKKKRSKFASIHQRLPHISERLLRVEMPIGAVSEATRGMFSSSNFQKEKEERRLQFKFSIFFLIFFFWQDESSQKQRYIDLDMKREVCACALIWNKCW